uniref:Uncharacterized protein AlNc14C76G5115 n=1 Tax=Albugo laibachii Nc14 TaxID=890382 RepID=F0WER5_9STRA|nr:conserved hypothetical protein [Albugo laibachii Nc14]|eukprot:CCA19697.1 conserved hypothetical protein [Albugo laibachii Nc14]
MHHAAHTSKTDKETGLASDCESYQLASANPSENRVPIASPQQVVVGISASVQDEVEDWSSDFQLGSYKVLPSTQIASSWSIKHKISHPRTQSLQRGRESIGRDSRCMKRRAMSGSVSWTWYRRNLSKQKLNNARMARLLAERKRMRAVSKTVQRLRKNARVEKVESKIRYSESIVQETSDDELYLEGDENEVVAYGLEEEDKQTLESDSESEESDMEDWDTEFGFTNTSEDEEATHTNSKGVGSENFEKFLKAFHDMIGSDSIDGDEQDMLQKARSRSCSDEKSNFFQRPWNNSLSASTQEACLPSSGFEVSSRASLERSCAEFTLADRYRLVDVARSLSYTVRIERFPKPCANFSQIEQFLSVPNYTDAKFEQWLHEIVSEKAVLTKSEIKGATKRPLRLPALCKDSTAVPESEQAPRHTHSIIKDVYQRLIVYRYFGHVKSSQDLIQRFFYLSFGIRPTTTSTDANSSSTTQAEMVDLDSLSSSPLILEILMEAARVFGPNLPSNARYSMDPQKSCKQFQQYLEVTALAIPAYRNLLALIELRYICHHLVDFTNLENFRYEWSICDQFPPFLPMEPILNGASTLAVEVLEFYGALFSVCHGLIDLETSSNKLHIASPDAKMSEISPDASQPVWYGTMSDPVYLQALILCDIQNLYDGKSALVESIIPGLNDLVDYDSDTSSIHYSHRESEQESSLLSSGSPVRPSSSVNAIWNSVSQMLLLLRHDNEARKIALEALYEQLSIGAGALVKAKCAITLSGIHCLSSAGSMKTAESLAYEALCLLDDCIRQQFNTVQMQATEQSGHRDNCLTLMYNDSLLSELGRETLELLGNVLIRNRKYRYGIQCLEASCALYSLLYQNRDHEKLIRHMCALAIEADDSERALVLHETVMKSAQAQGNVNEYVYLTQIMANLWTREGNFMRAEQVVFTALQYLRDNCVFLPQYFSQSVSTSPLTDISSFNSRSATLTTSSISLGSAFRSLHYSECDTWLNHDISLHLVLRDIYRSSGRGHTALRVVNHVLCYSLRLPRGKRSLLRMILAEEALRNRMSDVSQVTLQQLEQEALLFSDRNRDVGRDGNQYSMKDNSGVSRNIGRGIEARLCYDLVVSTRYIMCRVNSHMRRKEYFHAYAWVTIAHLRSDDKSLRFQAKLVYLDGKILHEWSREKIYGRLSNATKADKPFVANIAQILKYFQSSVFSLSAQEQGKLQQRLELFRNCTQDFRQGFTHGNQAYWNAFERFQTLDDVRNQLKTLLGIVSFHIEPIREAVMVGADYDNMLVHVSCPNSKDCSNESLTCERLERVMEDTRESLLEAHKLLRSIMIFSEQVADPAYHLRTLIACVDVTILLDKVLPFHSGRYIKQAGAYWKEAVELLMSVFFRRVAVTCQTSAHEGKLGSKESLRPRSYALLPILNFCETWILRLQEWVSSLLANAGQLLQSSRLPNYLELILHRHLDELVSAELGLTSIAHHSRLFAVSESANWMRAHLSTDNSRPSSSSRLPGQHNSMDDTVTCHVKSPADPNKSSSNGWEHHRKNLSMSSISELLASNVSIASSLQDTSNLRRGRPPKTGLASINDFGQNDESNVIRFIPSCPVSEDFDHSAYSADLKSSRSRSRSISMPCSDALTSGYPNCCQLSQVEGNGSSQQLPRLADSVETSRLWWIFNSWTYARTKYCSGKIEITALRHQNLRILRQLLDAFDHRHTAFPDTVPAGMQKYNMMDIHSRAFFRYRDHMLFMDYDMFQTGGDDSFQLKAFPFEKGQVASWTAHLPRSDWYLTKYHNVETDMGSLGAGIVYTLRLLGIKNTLNVLSSLLLEKPLIVLGSSFGHVQQVIMTLIKFLQPFQWPYICIPFLPISSWQFLHESILSHLAREQCSNETQSSFQGRWNSFFSSTINENGMTTSTMKICPRHQPGSPFIIGIVGETWQMVTQQLKATFDGEMSSINCTGACTGSSRWEERYLAGRIIIIDLDAPPASLASTTNGTNFPRPWRKSLIDHLRKGVQRTRRKKRKSFLWNSKPRLSLLDILRLSRSQDGRETCGFSSGECLDSLQNEKRNSTMKTLDHKAPRKGHRYECSMECCMMFHIQLLELYEELVLCCMESQKYQTTCRKKTFKTHELKIWFSSSREIEHYAKKFLISKLYSEYADCRSEHEVLPLPRTCLDYQQSHVRSASSGTTPKHPQWFHSSNNASNVSHSSSWTSLGLSGLFSSTTTSSGKGGKF